MIFFIPAVVYATFAILLTIFSGHKLEKKYMTKVILLGLPVIILLRFSQPLGELVFIVSGAFLIKNKNQSFFKSFLISISTILYYIFFTELFNMVIDFLSHQTTEVLLTNKTLTTIFLGIQILLMILSAYLLSKRLIFKDDMTLSKKEQMTILSLGMFIFIGIYGAIFYVVDGNNIAYLLMLIFIVIFLMFLTILYMLYKSSMKEQSLLRHQLELKQLETYTDNLEIIYKDMRKIRHDYTNVLSSMAGYMNEKNLEGLIDYFENNILPFNNQMRSYDFQLGQLSGIKQSELKGLVALKVIKAQELSIDVHLDIDEDIEYLDIDRMDMCRVIGILLDNAIEACERCDKPALFIGLLNKDNQKLLIVENTYNEEIKSLYTIYQEGYSSKGDNRGIGLSNLKELLNPYEKVSLDTRIEETLFSQMITIDL